ncbi:MAG: TonB-dependent receptor plug domain-containing protein, partial [Pseudomonadales bacterium]
MNNVKLSRAVKLAILAASGTAVALPAMAQEAELEEITVTGSRIIRTDLESVSPLTVVNAEEFVISGNLNIEQKLNELPMTIPSFGPSSNNPGDGTARVDLRGLGSVRTLVLVNGRRYIPSTQSGIVDLNTIPGTLIKQVDVVTGGASAVYGSDALAGVVNFQLRDDFEGVEITGLYDITTEGDAEKYNFDITIGGNFADGRGNGVIYTSYSSRTPLFQGERDASRFALTDSAPAGTPGQDPKTGIGGPLAAGGSSGVPGTRLFTGPTVDPDGVPGSGDEFILGFFTAGGGGAPWVEPDSRFNYAPDNYLQLPQDRYLTHAAAHFDITERATIFGEMSFALNEVPQELAPTPAFLGTVEVNHRSAYFQPEIQVALQSLITQDTNGDGVIDINDNAHLPFIGRRMVENGSRQAFNNRN